MSQSKKNNKGFTLVEVIVVAVIVAILAAVAIPIYQQYVKDSANNTAQNTGGSVASFCGACLAKNDVGCPTAVTAGVVGGTDITCGGTTVRIPENITVSVTARNGNTAGNVKSGHAKGDASYEYKF